jgi:hypothetical protein
MALMSEIRDKYPQYEDLTDKELADGFHNKFYSDIPIDDFYRQVGVDTYADERTLGGSVAEFAKSIPREFAGAFLSTGEGLAELADAGANALGFEDLIDSGDDNELVRLAREGRKSLDASFLGGDVAYQDEWFTKFGGALGTMASFLTPAGAAKLAGATGKGLGAVSKAKKASEIALTGGLGTSRQAEGVRQRRALGEEVSQEEEDLAVGLGAVIGQLDRFQISSMLRRIPKSAPANFVDAIKQNLKSASRSGLEEAVQETTTEILQNAVERGIYNENLAVDDSLYNLVTSDEFTIGGATGFATDLLLNSIVGKRNRYATKAEEEREGELRVKRDERIALGEEAVSKFQAEEAQGAEQRAQEEQGLDFQPSQATVDPSQIDPPTPEQITKKLRRAGRYLQVTDATDPDNVETYQAEEKVRRRTVKGNTIETRYIVDVKPDGTTQEKTISKNGIPNPDIAIQEIAPPSERFQTITKANPPIDYSNHIFRVMGRSFPTAGSFQVDMLPSAKKSLELQNARRQNQGESDLRRLSAEIESLKASELASGEQSLGANQVVHITPDGKKTPFGRNVQTLEEASVIAGRLNEKIIDSQVNNSVTQIINNSTESYSPEVKSTLVTYGDTILHPDESTFTSSAIDSAAGTIAPQFQENASAKDLVMQGVSQRKMTASQKLNAKRIAKGLPETNTFTPAEAKSVLKDKFSRLIRPPEALDNAIYNVKATTNKKGNITEIFLRSGNGDKITTRPPTPNEAMFLQERTGRYSKYDGSRNVKFKDVADAKAYAEKLNSSTKSFIHMDSVLDSGDTNAKLSVVADALQKNNIVNEIGSPAIRMLAENFTGVKATGNRRISDMNQGELKALVSGIRSLPRFDVPTKLPLFKHNRYTSDQFGKALEFVKQNDNDTTNTMGIAQAIGLDPMTDPQALKIAEVLGKDLKDHIKPVQNMPKLDPADAIPQGQGLVVYQEPKVNLNKLTAILRRRINSQGLSDVGLNVDHSLRHVSRNKENQLVFGVRQAQQLDKNNEKMFDSDGKPVMGAERNDENLNSPEKIKERNGYVMEGFYSPDINAVFLAVDAIRGSKDMSPAQLEAAFIEVLDHEIVHGMRQLDLWTEKEWQLLSSQASKRKNLQGVTFLNAAKKAYYDKSPVVQMEEAIVEMVRESKLDPKIITGKPRTLLKRISDFFTKSVSAINGFGYNSFESIIQDIQSGVISVRERGPVRTLLETERLTGTPSFDAQGQSRASVVPSDETEAVPVQDGQRMGDFANVDTDASIVQVLPESEIMESRRSLSTPIQNAIELSTTKYAEYNTQVEEEFFGNFWPSVMQEVKGTVTPDKVRTAAKRAIKDINQFVSDNPKYKDYYQEDMRTIKALLESEFGPMSNGDMLFYQVANGLNSPATTLTANVGDAINVFDLYKREGNLDSIQMGVSAKGNPVVASSNPFKLSGTSGSNKARTLKIIDGLAKEMGGMEQAINFMKEPVTAEELQAFNRQMGYKTKINLTPIESLVELATGQNVLIPRMFIFGKKIGAYTLNLTGDSRYTTIDVWESRFIRSYFEGLFEKNTGIPVNVAEDVLFQDFSKVFKEEYDKLTGTNADPASLQAMRWFYMINAAKQSGYRGASTNETISELTNKKLTRLRENRNVGRPEDDGTADSKVPTKTRRKQVYRELRSPQLSESGSGANEGGVPRRFRPRTGRHSQVLVAGQEVLGSKRELTPSAKTALQEVDSYNGTVIELASNATNASLFASKMQASKDASPYGAAVYMYPESDYQNMKMFMTEDGSAGIAIEDGDTIVSLYSDGTHRNVTYPLASLAVEEGGLYSDAFDTQLPIIYEDVGFKVVSRLKWDDSKAPPDWDKNTFKRFNKGEI